MCARVHMCVRTCAHVRVTSGLSIHYGLMLTHYTILYYIRVKTLSFILCGTICVCFYLQVTSRNVTRPITRLNSDRHMSLTRGGTWHHLIRRRFDQTAFKLNRSSGELQWSRLNVPNGHMDSSRNQAMPLLHARRDKIWTLHLRSDERDLKTSIYESTFNLNH